MKARKNAICCASGLPTPHERATDRRSQAAFHLLCECLVTAFRLNHTNKACDEPPQPVGRSGRKLICIKWKADQGHERKSALQSPTLEELDVRSVANVPRTHRAEAPGEPLVVARQFLKTTPCCLGPSALKSFRIFKDQNRCNTLQNRK